MPYPISTNELLKKVKILAGIINPRTPLETYKGIRFIFKKGEGLYLTSTNGNVTINTFVQGNEFSCPEDGQCVIEADGLFNLLKNLSSTKEEHINLDINENNVVIYPHVSEMEERTKKKKFTYKVATLPIEDFSPFAVDGQMESYAFDMDIAEFVDIFNRFAFCTFRGDEKPHLAGVCFENNHIISTDGNRGSILKMDNVMFKNQVLFTPMIEKVLNLLASEKDITEEQKKIVVTDYLTFIGITTCGFNIVFSKLSTPFPSEVFLTKFDEYAKTKNVWIKFDVNTLSSALKRLKALGCSDANYVKLTLDKDSTELKLNVETNKANATETIDVDRADELVEYTIRLSLNYLIDALEYFSGSVEYFTMDSKSPQIISDGNFLHFIMGLRG